MPYLVVSSALFIVLAVFFRVRSWWLAAPYLLAATASGATIGKSGSNVNYLFEFSAGLAFMAGSILATTGKNRWTKAILIGLLAVQVPHYPDQGELVLHMIAYQGSCRHCCLIEDRA
jgi:hypothetical protein